MSDEATAPRPTNLADLMAELIPPPEPDPISLVPQTLGWPVAVVLLLALTVFLALRMIRARRAEAYRRAALIALDAAGTEPGNVAKVLRQTALTAFPRDRVASLHGQDWLDFLAETGGQESFRGEQGQALITLPYSNSSQLSQATLSLARDWIRTHDRTAAS